MKDADEQAAAQLGPGLRFDYARPREKPAGEWLERESRHALLRAVAEDAERALRAVEREPELAEQQLVEGAVALLREIVGREFEVADDGVPHIRRPKDPARCSLPTTPSFAMAVRPPPSASRASSSTLRRPPASGPLLTAISVTPGSVRDSRNATALVDGQPEERRPERVLGDTAYGGGRVRQELRERGVEVLSPVHETSPRDRKRIPKGEFSIDLEAGTVTCPQGETASRASPATCGRRGCGSSDCSACSSTATEAARAATSDAEKRSCRPLGRRWWSPAPPSGRPCGAREPKSRLAASRHRRGRSRAGEKTARTGSEAYGDLGFFGGLAPKRDAMKERAS